MFRRIHHQKFKTKSLLWRIKTQQKYKLLCPRGTQTCALAVANIKVNGNGKVILDTHPESTKIELVLEVHPLLPPTIFGGDPWTRSWDILRTKTVRTDTRRWSQDLAAYGAQVNIEGTLMSMSHTENFLLVVCMSNSVSIQGAVASGEPSKVGIL